LKSGSRAQKLAAKVKARRVEWAKRGRPMIEGVFREPNGRISRAKKPPEPADKLALEARARQLGVSVRQARDPRLGSYIGRLVILGAEHGGLSEAQYGAALRFLEVRNNWLRAIGSTAAHYEERVASSEDDSQEEAVKRDKARYEAMMKALQEAQFDNRQENLGAALQYLVIDDLELPYMIGTLRVALNALSRHFS